MERTDLTQPKHLPDEQWEAIDACRQRLAAALEVDDRPAALGAAKDLAESVARSVLHITGTTLGSGTDYSKVIATAQKKLGMHPASLTNPDVRPIATSALTIASTLGTVRNAAGTGHGRATVPPVDDQVLNASVDAALLWSRWALTVLTPILLSAPSTLIQAVQNPTARRTLQDLFGRVQLHEQSEQDQHDIGVAFGQRAAGGFGNAWNVGVTPAVNDTRLDRWPAAYRLGLTEGLVIDILGDIQLRVMDVEDIVSLTNPVDREHLMAAMKDLADKVRHSTWSTTWRPTTPKDAAATITALREALKSSRHKGAFTDLTAALEEALGSDA